MPMTRTRSQATLEFPAKKRLRTSKSRVKVFDENNIQPLESPRKRAIINDVESLSSSTPPKLKRRSIKNVDKENSHSIQHVKSVLSPVKQQPNLTPVRLPLSPRKDFNILSPLRDLNSPSKRQVHRCSPGKENAATPIITPINSPRRIRALNFNSPPKENCLTPYENNSPKITKCRALSFDSPAKSQTSPRKSIGTPRPNIKTVISPLRLAKQEGVCYQRAKKALHTAMPGRLVCREEELGTVNKFLENHLYAKKPGSLYVSGAPGTGKTAVLTQTMERLRAEKTHLIYINCMSLRNSQAIYNTILGDLKGHSTSLSAKHAQAELEGQLSAPAKGKMVVLILDEMDQLDSKNQEILYTMFEWPSLAKSRLVLIGIANALDLTDRILPRLQARPNCKPQLLNFAPYTREQIVTVLQERLKQVEVDGHTVLETSALRFCACKVAAVAGDMRKALDVCRRAVEMVEAEVRKQQVLSAKGLRSPSKTPAVPRKIGVPHILKIINEVYGSRMSSQSNKPQTIPLQQKLAICSLLLLLKDKKKKEAPAGKLHETYTKVCKKQNVTPADQSEFLSMCGLIEARGILGLKKTKDARSTKITLKLDEKEVENALQDKTLISSVLSKGL